MRIHALLFLSQIIIFNCLAQSPGNISPNAKLIDADKLYPFNDGFAVITKGTADALLKPDGTLSIPFNKYTFEQVSVLFPDIKGNYYQFPAKGFVNGFAVVRPIGKAGKVFHPIFINLQGKEMFSPSISANDPFVNGKTEVYTISKSGKSIGNFLLTNGTLIPHKVLTNGLAAGLPDPNVDYSIWQRADNFRYQCENRKYGFINMRGNLIINCQYDAVGDFSEGIAKVMKINELGESKWGFINSTGKQIIGFIFSHEPNDFHCGLAAVFPKDGSDFSYAYIDTTGQIKIKSNLKRSYKLSQNRSSDSERVLDFVSGYARWSTDGKIFIDTSGVLHDLSSLKGEFTFNGKTHSGLSGSSFHIDHSWHFQNGQIEFSWNGGHGLADINGNIIVPPLFLTLGHFDPVSKLAYANTRDNNGKLTEGYINRQGVFVIVKGGGSKW